MELRFRERARRRKRDGSLSEQLAEAGIAGAASIIERHRPTASCGSGRAWTELVGPHDG